MKNVHDAISFLGIYPEEIVISIYITEILLLKCIKVILHFVYDFLVGWCIHMSSDGSGEVGLLQKEYRDS